MKRLKTVLMSFATTVVSCLALVAAGTASAQTAAPAKSVVLVHGAFADGCSWDGVVP